MDAGGEGAVCLPILTWHSLGWEAGAWRGDVWLGPLLCVNVPGHPAGEAPGGEQRLHGGGPLPEERHHRDLCHGQPDRSVPPPQPHPPSGL